MEEQRLIREEIANRCPTPEVEEVPDEWKNFPPYWEPLVYPREPTLRVVRPLLLREDVTSSQPIVSNPSTPPFSAAKLSFRLTSATSAFTPRSPVQQPRKSLNRLPTNILRFGTRFQTETLQNLLVNNDFLTATPVSDLTSASRNNSTFGEVNSNTPNLSYRLRTENSPGLYPRGDYSIVDSVTDPLFLFEKAPQTNPLHKVLSHSKSPNLKGKKSTKAQNRRAFAWQIANTIVGYRSRI